MAHNPAAAVVITILDKGDEYLLNAVSSPTEEEFNATVASGQAPTTPTRPSAPRASATGHAWPTPPGSTLAQAQVLRNPQGGTTP